MFKEFYLWCALIFFVGFVALIAQTGPEIVAYEEEQWDALVDIPIPPINVHVATYEVMTVNRISAYNPVPRQTQGNPNVSSCGPNLEKQIAVSRDIFFDSQGRKHLCGTRVTVVTDRGEVFTDYVIWDTMNPRFRNTVDIMLPHTNEAEAFAFGVTTGVVYLYID